MENPYTIIWMTEDLVMGIETYEGPEPTDAINAWEEETENGTLIGVLGGQAEIYFWQS